MAENSNSDTIGEATTKGAAALKRSLEAATDSLGSAGDHLDDGIDLVRGWAESLNDFVARQPLVAVAGAFLIGYAAARMLRRVSSR
jgi:hypothetical protein